MNQRDADIQPQAAANDELIVTSEGALGVIRLNRPKTINALTLEMTRGIAAALAVFESDPSIGLILIEGSGERGFCAGGDIRGLYDSMREGGELGKIFWREEYILNARIASCPKPYVAFMDGLVMGGGVGLSAHGRHRIVTEKTRLAMPEVGIGFFPDVGGSWLLSRAPGELGTYFGLTGLPMTAADAIRCGFGDITIETAAWPAARAALARLGPATTNGMVRGVLAHFAASRQQGPVEKEKALIDRAFAFDTAEEIVEALLREPSSFALAARQAMLEKSPTSLKVALRLLREARGSQSLDQCLIREYGAALEVFVSHDFPEGIRAAVIDKDRKPKWRPPALSQVTPEMVGAFFAPRGDDELVIPKREALP
jgi:enoyl-CoA hydratase